MPKITIDVDSETKNATVSIDGTVIPGISSVGYHQYMRCGCDDEKEYKVTEVYLSTREKGDDGFTTTRSLSWMWDDRENTVAQVSESKTNPAKSLLAGVLESRIQRKS